MIWVSMLIGFLVGFRLGTKHGKGFCRCFRFTYCKTKRILQGRYKPRSINVR